MRAEISVTQCAVIPFTPIWVFPWSLRAALLADVLPQVSHSNGFPSQVPSDVHIEVELLLERYSTHLALVMSVSCVTSYVHVEVEFLFKCLSTHLALVPRISVATFNTFD